VLTALAALPPSPARDTATRDLTARRTMLASTACAAAGYLVGSGGVERANKRPERAPVRRRSSSPAGSHYKTQALAP